jgi:hypothetical protein
MRAPTTNPVTQTKHGDFNAVDYSYLPDTYFYAPEDGTVTFLQVAGDCGLNLQVTSGNHRHGFCHLEQSYVAVGEQIKKGQKIGKMGYSGLTIPKGPDGRHLHWVICLIKENKYVYPPDLVDEQEDGGEEMAVSEQIPDAVTIQLEYNNGLLRQPSNGELASWAGKTLEEVQRGILGSPEHEEIQRLVELGKKVDAGLIVLKPGTYQVK